MELNFYEKLIHNNNKEMEETILKQNKILDEIIDSFINLRKSQNIKKKLIEQPKVKKEVPNHFLEYID